MGGFFAMTRIMVEMPPPVKSPGGHGSSTAFEAPQRRQRKQDAVIRDVRYDRPGVMNSRPADTGRKPDHGQA
jgi:hypothetical protein